MATKAARPSDLCLAEWDPAAGGADPDCSPQTRVPIIPITGLQDIVPALQQVHNRWWGFGNKVKVHSTYTAVYQRQQQRRIMMMMMMMMCVCEKQTASLTTHGMKRTGAVFYWSI